ncbi:MAG: hypothetical protein AAFQ95_01970, partial [Cyanobacteria bacterium J06621_3]
MWFQRKRWQCLAVLTFALSVLLHSVPAATAQQVPLPPTSPTISNTATATYISAGTSIDAVSNQIRTEVEFPLIDPAGQVLGCDGQSLSSYAGFSMALYETDASGLGLGNLVLLTDTTDPDDQVAPNLLNDNPFPLSAGGRYNFLLDESENQTDAGRTYILVINPPSDSPFQARRLRIEMLGVKRNTDLDSVVLNYEVTSLDGQPISLNGQTSETFSIEERGQGFAANKVTLSVGLDSVLCEADQVSIVKTADRSAAQPGDLVVYRFNIKNLAPVDVNTVTATDTLPVGFEFVADSVSAQVAGNDVAVTASAAGNRVTFVATAPLAPAETLDIIYAARISPDALRGSGRNSVLLTARRSDSNFQLQDGPSIHRLTLDPGILSDCGTLIGRVFEDKNFDGEQQPGEAGIPNAVIFLDDGNRVVTDADGLFSVQKMLPGQRTGTLDISSLPGYTLAPNLHFNERNSVSRLVNLSPGGLVKMNFGVTPTFQEVE